MRLSEKMAKAIINWQLGQEAALTTNEQDTLLDAVTDVARAAVAEAVEAERAKIMRFLNNTAQAQRELARIEIEDYSNPDAAQAAQGVAEAIDHIVRWIAAQEEDKE